ncbi:MAG: M56 family metallopeptidase [Rhodothermales bacterium]
MLDLILELGRWSLEGFWLPLLAWSLLALPAYAAVKLCTDRSPHVRYWTLVALLLSLPIGVAGAALAMFDAPAMSGVAIVTMPAAFSISAEAAAQTALNWTTWHTSGLLTLLACVVALWRVSTLVVGFRALRSIRKEAVRTPEWVVEEAHTLAAGLGLERSVDVRLGATASPFTIGWLRPLIVLPEDLLEERADLRRALTHELVHVRRRDFGLQVVEQVIGALFVIHPLVALIRRETSVLREITCDADVVSRTGERAAYARVLYRYSTPNADRMLAVGIFARERHLPKRIRAMQSFLSEHGLNRSKQKGLAVFILLLSITIGAVACSDVLVESTADADAQTSARTEASSGDTFVVVEDMPELIGGLESIQENLHYPELAAKAGIEGRVIVQFVVDEEGRVVDPEIVRGIGSGLDEAALAAVRTAEFKPGLQRGKPVQVKMSLPVTFMLGDADGSEPN